MVEKYGFVYIWFDRYRKMYYIGCHWGTENDGYLCSSNRMRDAYRRRPHDFKRRILKRIYSTRQDTFNEEQRYLDMIKLTEINIRYYNLNTKVVGNWVCAEESRKKVSKKISEAHMGKTCSDETKRKISIGNCGKIHSDETKRKISIGNCGKTRSDETKQTLREINLGKTHSDETKRKMSEKLKGRKLSEDHIQKIIKGNTGKTRSDETKRKLSEIRKGKKHSEDHKRKISEAMKRKNSINE